MSSDKSVSKPFVPPEFFGHSVACRQLKDRPFAVLNTEPSKTVQSHALGITPSEIIDRFSSTGQLPQSLKKPLYLDTTLLPQGIDALNLQRSFGTFWAGVSPAVKELYPTPELFVKACTDPTQKDQLIKLGVFRVRPPDAPALGTKDNPTFTMTMVPTAPPPDKGAGSTP